MKYNILEGERNNKLSNQKASDFFELRGQKGERQIMTSMDIAFLYLLNIAVILLGIVYEYAIDN